MVEYYTWAVTVTKGRDDGIEMTSPHSGFATLVAQMEQTVRCLIRPTRWLSRRINERYGCLWAFHALLAVESMIKAQEEALHLVSDTVGRYPHARLGSACRRSLRTAERDLARLSRWVYDDIEDRVISASDVPLSRFTMRVARGYIRTLGILIKRVEQAKGADQAVYYATYVADWVRTAPGAFAVHLGMPVSQLPMARMTPLKTTWLRDDDQTGGNTEIHGVASCPSQSAEGRS